MRYRKSDRMRMAIIAAILLILTITASFATGCKPIQTVDEIIPASVDNADFTATQYTDSYGNVIDGLQEAVAGKEYWLETETELKANVRFDGNQVIMENGIVKRAFNIPTYRDGNDAFYTAEFSNTYTETQLIESITPECVIGLYDQPYRNIYDEKTDLTVDSDDRTLIRYAPDECFVGGRESGDTFRFKGYTIYETCEGRFTYRPEAAWSDPSAGEYPSKGKRVEFLFEADAQYGCSEAFARKYGGLEIKIAYEIYDGVPAIKKRIDFVNQSDKVVTVGRLMTEVLDLKEESASAMEIETTYVCGDDTTISFNSPLPCDCASESRDSAQYRYSSYRHACYDLGPAYQLDYGQSFETFDTYEYIYSTYWFEQQAKERLGIYRVLFPWILDNPLTFHSTKKLTEKVIDHAAEAGFEMVIQSFGVSDDSEYMMTRNPKALEKWKGLVEYAHSKGVGIGIYQWQYMLDQFKTSAAYGKNDLGKWGTWCVASTAFEDYYRDFIHFLEYTGVDCVEIDGPYPNCPCNNGEQHVDSARTTHALHNGYFDSKVKQWENGVRELTAKLRELGVYVKTPAWYYMSGSNKCGIGYEEIAWSQPRKEQLLYGRQILHNGSYVRTMSMSWTFIPLDVYHGGGLSASFKPFVFNQFDYDWVMAQSLCNGLTSDIRGSSLYDFATLETIRKWTDFYKRHRSVINADIVHIKQAQVKSEKDRSHADGIDAIYHTNAKLTEEKGLLWVYNQTEQRRNVTLSIPTYYSGLTDLDYPPAPVYGSTGKMVKVYGEYPPNYSWLPTDMLSYRLPDPTERVSGIALVVDAYGNEVAYDIDSNGNVTITFTMEPMTYTYFIVKDGNHRIE